MPLRAFIRRLYPDRIGACLRWCDRTKEDVMRQQSDFRRGFQFHFALMGAIATICVVALIVAFVI
jgi:hypothetical protein